MPTRASEFIGRIIPVLGGPAELAIVGSAVPNSGPGVSGLQESKLEGTAGGAHLWHHQLRRPVPVSRWVDCRQCADSALKEPALKAAFSTLCWDVAACPCQSVSKFRLTGSGC